MKNINIKTSSSCKNNNLRRLCSCSKFIAILVFYCKTHCQVIVIKSYHAKFCNTIIAKLVLLQNLL